MMLRVFASRAVWPATAATPNSAAARIAMIRITTISSMSVKADRERNCEFRISDFGFFPSIRNPHSAIHNPLDSRLSTWFLMAASFAACLRKN